MTIVVIGPKATRVRPYSPTYRDSNRQPLDTRYLDTSTPPFHPISLVSDIYLTLYKTPVYSQA